MRRALVGTLAGWLAGAAGVLAQSPLPPLPPANAGYYPATARGVYPGGQYEEPRMAPGPQFGPTAGAGYGPLVGAASGPMMAHGYGPAYGHGGVPMTPVSSQMPPMGGAPAAPAAGPMAGSSGPILGNANMPAAPAMAGPVGPNGWMAAPGPWGNSWGYSDCGNGAWGGNCGYGDCGWANCGCGPCGPEGRMWASVELLLWWTKGQNLPPLVTAGTGANNPGILGQPDTVILYGNSPVGDYMRVGVRPRIGFWLDECRMIGVEASAFYLGQAVDTFQTNNTAAVTVSRPFFNTDPAVNAQDVELVNVPGVIAGNVTVTTTSELYGADINIRRALWCNCGSRVDFVAGFRYQHLSDSLNIVETLTNLDPARGVIGEGFIVRDSFGAINNFYGGQLGLAGEFGTGGLFVDWRVLFALGGTQRFVDIDGSTTFIDQVTPLPTVTQPGGLLAQPSNMGRHSSSGFSFIPEVNVNLGWALTPGTRVYVGYNFMYWTNVARAGEQVNLNVDATQLPTRAGPGVGTQPVFVLQTNDFWAQGINFGLQLRY